MTGELPSTERPKISRLTDFFPPNNPNNIAVAAHLSAEYARINASPTLFGRPISETSICSLISALRKPDKRNIPFTFSEKPEEQAEELKELQDIRRTVTGIMLEYLTTIRTIDDQIKKLKEIIEKKRKGVKLSSDLSSLNRESTQFDQQLKASITDTIEDLEEEKYLLERSKPSTRQYIDFQISTYQIMSEVDKEISTEEKPRVSISREDREELRRTRNRKQLTPDEFRELYRLIRETGGSPTNLPGIMDYINGLPFSSQRDFEKTLKFLRRTGQIMKIIRGYVPTITKDNAGVIEQIRKEIAFKFHLSDQVIGRVCEIIFQERADPETALAALRKAEVTALGNNDKILEELNQPSSKTTEVKTQPAENPPAVERSYQEIISSYEKEGQDVTIIKYLRDQCRDTPGLSRNPPLIEAVCEAIFNQGYDHISIFRLVIEVQGVVPSSKPAERVDLFKKRLTELERK